MSWESCRNVDPFSLPSKEQVKKSNPLWLKSSCSCVAPALTTVLPSCWPCVPKCVKYFKHEWAKLGVVTISYLVMSFSQSIHHTCSSGAFSLMSCSGNLWNLKPLTFDFDFVSGFLSILPFQMSLIQPLFPTVLFSFNCASEAFIQSAVTTPFNLWSMSHFGSYVILVR